ncbi:hypothetical protein GCM10023201_33450 [Actinomycetospora corticicola]|uniref:mannan endo-1,4-beta-mannosidase n=1 Tax=Actinomycetospora corticicola TaxID=663602 RepID=A0A7Y9DS48_9PSEU|nr:cellulase family glycosylhydrolase [Actinomycetospora corticicola]NYD34531.1 hypothetical protein [Actinomycetospora corticicola]
MSDDEVAERGASSSQASRRRPRIILGGVVAALLVIAGVVVATTTNGMRDERPQAMNASAARPPAPPSFIGRNGTQLVLEGKPYRFTGFNSYVMLGCGDPDEKLTPEARDAFFAGLQPLSVVRVFMLPGTSTADTDALVAAAAAHDVRLVVALTDDHANCGDTKKDEAFYAGGYRGAYLDWVRTIVPRYRDSVTIGMWELVNEPGTRNIDVLRAFFDDAGGLVHQLDPNHLLSAGTSLPDGLGGADGFLRLMSSPAIDVVSMHEYDSVSDVSPHLDDVLDVAKDVGKPILVGEWGLDAGGDQARAASGGTCLSVDGRAAVARDKIAAYLKVPEVAGLLYWSYTARGINPTTPDCSYSTTESDPLFSSIHDVRIPSTQG